MTSGNRIVCVIESRQVNKPVLRFRESGPFVPFACWNSESVGLLVNRTTSQQKDLRLAD